MKIIGLPDIHGDFEKIQRLESRLAEVDLVLLIGDITDFGHKAEMEEMVSLVRTVNNHCICVPGNCDYPETEKVLNSMELNLNGFWKDIGGISFVGLGGSLATPFNGTPFEVPDLYFQTKLENAEKDLPAERPMILVSHQPPHGTKADSLNNGMHVGSLAVRRFIEKHQPLVCFTGHIHEGKGISDIGSTQVINPGPVFKGNYAYAEIDNDVKLLEIREV